jgi:hypothetical protein
LKNDIVKQANRTFILLPNAGSGGSVPSRFVHIDATLKADRRTER